MPGVVGLKGTEGRQEWRSPDGAVAIKENPRTYAVAGDYMATAMGLATNRYMFYVASLPYRGEQTCSSTTPLPTSLGTLPQSWELGDDPAT